MDEVGDRMSDVMLHDGPMPLYDANAPRGLVVAASDGTARAAERALALTGCTARRSISFAEALADSDSYDGLDLVLVEAAGADEAMLEAVLTQLDALSQDRGVGVIVAMEPDQIDLVAARLTTPHAQLLCASSDAERTSAVAAAKWATRGEVNDIGRDSDAAHLQRVHEEVARFAETLVRLAREDQRERATVRAPASTFKGEHGGHVDVTAAEVRGVIRARRARAQFFGAELVEDPGWDMLLDLFAASLERRRVSVSSLCIAAAVAPTTALRWISKMHEAGLFERQADPEDRRRAYILLSAKGLEAMRGYVSAVKRAGLPLV